MQPRKMMGFETPGDQRVPIPVRDWSAMRLALWRSRVGWEIAERAAAEIIDRCQHTEGCPGIKDETAACLSDRYSEPTTDADGNVIPGVRVVQGCPDREQRMSALVILNAARMFAPIDARQPANGPYMAPSREYFSEILTELAIAQQENDALRAKLRESGLEPPTPPSNLTQASAQLTSAQPEESQ